MDKTFTVKLDKTLYDWIHTYAIQNDLSVSQVIRHSIRAHTGFNEAQTKPEPVPTKPAFDPNEVLPSGYTRAERDALLERAKQAQSEPSPQAAPTRAADPTKPVKSFDDLLADWKD